MHDLATSSLLFFLLSNGVIRQLLFCSSPSHSKELTKHARSELVSLSSLIRIHFLFAMRACYLPIFSHSHSSQTRSQETFTIVVLVDQLNLSLCIQFQRKNEPDVTKPLGLLSIFNQSRLHQRDTPIQYLINHTSCSPFVRCRGVFFHFPMFLHT